tara:strand:+ start:167 stop:394 length:228 start_codon:yes stop_codon:yes gene_type:complete
MTELEKFKEFVKWFNELVFGTEDGLITPDSKKEKPKRARTKKGRYIADDKSTKDVNEAWVGGKAPKKKKTKRKKK